MILTASRNWRMGPLHLLACSLGPWWGNFFRKLLFLISKLNNQFNHYTAAQPTKYAWQFLHPSLPGDLPLIHNQGPIIDCWVLLVSCPTSEFCQSDTYTVYQLSLSYHHNINNQLKKSTCPSWITKTKKKKTTNNMKGQDSMFQIPQTQNYLNEPHTIELKRGFFT